MTVLVRGSWRVRVRAGDVRRGSEGALTRDSEPRNPGASRTRKSEEMQSPLEPLKGCSPADPLRSSDLQICSDADFVSL